MGVGGQDGVILYPSYLISVLEGEVKVVKPDASARGRGALQGSSPVDELSLGNRERETFLGRNAAKRAVLTLEELDIPPVGGRYHCNHKIVNGGKD